MISEDEYEDEYEDENYEEYETTTDETNESKKTVDSSDVNTICLYCNKKDMPHKHWISKCRSVNSRCEAELQQLFFCTLCLYLKKRNQEHWCKDFFF